jgi:GWxTD domain-containing protein
MKRLIIVLFFCSGFLSVSTAKNLQSLFSYKTFYSPENGPYFETYLSVKGNSVNYSKNANGKFQGSIEITLRVSDATGIKYTDKYNLLSPEVADTSNLQFSFIDQQRIPMANGKYKVEMAIHDRSNADKSFNVSQMVSLEYYNNIAAVSDIQFVDSYSKTTEPTILSKSGYDLVPYVDNFFPNAMKSLRFYAEVYNTDKIMGTSPYLLSFFVESAESKLVIENMKGFTKQNPEKVNVLLRELPISDLPSGNYNLVVEVRNQQNELIAVNSAYFQRSNVVMLGADNDFSKVNIQNTFASYITNKDTLIDHINSLTPIANSLEETFLNNQMKLADVKLMQQFFYDFWSRRSPVNPEKAWMDYHTEVLKVNNEYGTKIIKGYNTDRGRVYLKYGAPNTITKNDNEPSAYPYEIWHYYKLENQTNRKFIFYNPDLVTNDFTLLHSDAQGEVYNDRWQLDLHKRDTQSHNLDSDGNKGNYFYGNKADDTFKNPR